LSVFAPAASFPCTRSSNFPIGLLGPGQIIALARPLSSFRFQVS